MNKLQQLRIEWTKAKRAKDFSLMKIVEARAKMLPKENKLWSDAQEVFPK